MYVSLESPVNPSLTLITSWVANVEGKRIYREDWTLQQAAEFFAPSFPPVVTKEEREVKQLFSFNIYKSGTTRGKQNVEAMTGIVLDFDNKLEEGEEFVPIQTVLDRLNDKRIIYFFYTSWSHTLECPRWRLIIPFGQACPVGDWSIVYDQMVILIGNPPGIDHSACRDVAHIWFPPYDNSQKNFEKFACQEGFVLNPLDLQLLLTPEQQAEYVRQQEQKKQKSLHPINDLVPLSEASTFTLEQIREALDSIDPSCDYHKWIRVGMALHHYFGGTTTGFDLWLEWSRKSTEKFPKGDGKSVLLAYWGGFSNSRDNQITAATLIHYAQEKGYVLYPDLGITVIDSREEQATPAYSITEVVDEEEDEDELREEYEMARYLREQEVGDSNEATISLETNEEESQASDFQIDFSDYEQVGIYDFPHPLLKEIYGYLLQCGRYRVPLYALNATIPLTGFLLRNYVQSFSKLRTNFMTLSIGMSGTGKTQILMGIQRILKFLAQQNHLVTTLGTIQGCVEALRQKEASLLLVQDEATYWAKGSKNKNLSIHEDAVSKFRLEMFSCPLFYMPPAAKSADLTPIEEPFFTEISSATPDILKHFSSDDYNKGLLPRYLVFKQEKASFDRNPVFDGELPASLQATLERCRPQQNYDRLRGLLDEEATLFFAGFDKKVEQIRHRVLFESDHPHASQMDALLARLCEHAEKLSLLGAVRNTATYTIPLKAIQWGVAVTLLSFKNLCQIMEEGLYENQTEEHRARILSIVKKKSQAVLSTPQRGWVTRSVISWSVKFLKARELTEILYKLREEGVLEMKENGEKKIFIKYIEKGGKST